MTAIHHGALVILRSSGDRVPPQPAMGKPAMRSRPVVLAINGELVAVPPGGDLSQSLVEFIRTQTRFTVSKRPRCSTAASMRSLAETLHASPCPLPRT